MSTTMRETETSAPGLGDGTRIVPLMPTEAMWGGLARQIVMWGRQTRATGANLHRDLKNIGWPIPDWLGDEIEDADHVPSKGSVAVAIYRAMLDAAPPTTMAEAVASARAEGEQYKAALKLAMQYMDRCAGEDLGFFGDGDRPATDAVDVCFAVADVLGIEDLDSDAYRALVAYPAGRAALAERGGSE